MTFQIRFDALELSIESPVLQLDKKKSDKMPIHSALKWLKQFFLLKKWILNELCFDQSSPPPLRNDYALWNINFTGKIDTTRWVAKMSGRHERLQSASETNRNDSR